MLTSRFRKILIGSPLVVKSEIAFLDQAVLSAINFLVSVILIKSVPKDEYGYYSIAIAVSLFLISIQNAVVTTPLTVLLVTKKGGDKQAHIAALYFGQFIIVLPAVCISLAVIAIFYFLGLDVTKASIAGATCLATTGTLFREFLRAYYFAEESPLVVLKLDSYYAVAYWGLIVIVYLYFNITVSVVLVFMGISALFISTIFNCGQGWRFNRKSIQESYRENWKFGRWSLLGVLVTHIQSYSNLYLLGALLGSSAVAEVSASRLVLMPFLLIQASWGKIALPHGSKLRENQQIKRFLKEQVLAGLIVGITIAIYVWLLLISSDFLGKFLFTGKYEKALHFTVFWGAFYAVNFVGLNASFGLQVVKEFRIIAKINSITMIITVCSAYFSIKNYGIEGGLASMLLGEALLAAALWWVFGVKVFSTRENDLWLDSKGGFSGGFSRKESVTVLEE